MLHHVREPECDIHQWSDPKNILDAKLTICWALTASMNSEFWEKSTCALKEI